jgi:hypothetical protein
MPADDEQKKIWNQEKEQQRRDKLSQPKLVKRQPKNLRFAGAKPAAAAATTKPLSKPIPHSTHLDALSRQNLNINFDFEA